MILPCRIHRPRNRVDSLPLALLFAASLLAPVSSASAETDGSGGPSVPFQITAGVDIGYDDNVRSGSGAGGGAASVFARENLVLSYHRRTDRTEFDLLGVGGFTQFLDLGTDDKDGNITLSLTHKVSTRLSLYASAYAAYQTEPDFASNVGLENVRADHFHTNDIFSVSYSWLPRFATITTYTFSRVKYAESTAETSQQDRLQSTLAERLQFSLTSRTNLLGEYRFEIVDYDTAPRDSTTHFVLAGIDHNLTEHLSVSLLGGESFRSFKDAGDTINPYVEGTLAYESSNHSLDWTTSYRVEQPSAQQALTRTTIRTGLRLTYDLTSRIGSTVGVDYHHDENEGAAGTSVGSQDSFRAFVGLRYMINKHFALRVHYEHSMVTSLGVESGFSRNRYSGGLTYTY
jgi:hypothetical protein